MKENMWNFRWSRNLPPNFEIGCFCFVISGWHEEAVSLDPLGPYPHDISIHWLSSHNMAKLRYPAPFLWLVPSRIHRYSKKWSTFSQNCWLVHPVFIDIHSKIVPTFSQKKSKVFLPPPWTPWHPLDPRDVSRLFAEARLRRDRRLAKLATIEPKRQRRTVQVHLTKHHQINTITRWFPPQCGAPQL